MAPSRPACRRSRRKRRPWCTRRCHRTPRCWRYARTPCWNRTLRSYTRWHRRSRPPCPAHRQPPRRCRSPYTRHRHRTRRCWAWSGSRWRARKSRGYTRCRRRTRSLPQAGTRRPCSGPCSCMRCRRHRVPCCCSKRSRTGGCNRRWCTDCRHRTWSPRTPGTRRPDSRRRCCTGCRPSTGWPARCW